MGDSSIITPSCTYGLHCTHPIPPLMIRCRATGANQIHIACSRYDRCPFHVCYISYDYITSYSSL